MLDDFFLVGSNQSIDTLSIIYIGAPGKKKLPVPTNEIMGRYLRYIYGHLVAVPWD